MRVGQVQRAPHDVQRDDADRHVDEEDPAPAGDRQDRTRAGEEAAEHRPEHARRTEHGKEVALVLRSVARRHDVADDRQREREQAAGAEALVGAERGKHVHRGRERTGGGAGDEDGDRDEEERLAAVEVGQLAVERRRDRRRDQVGGGHPGLHRKAVQVVADRSDRGRDDVLVEGGEEHAEHQAGQDHQDLLVREPTHTRRRCCLARHRSGRGSAHPVSSVCAVCLAIGGGLHNYATRPGNSPARRFRLSRPGSNRALPRTGAARAGSQPQRGRWPGLSGRRGGRVAVAGR